MTLGRVAVTGASGRLGRAIVAELTGRGEDVVAWSRPHYDLDDPSAARIMVRRHRPSVIIHCAAWTDVDGCAREPDAAMRRNGAATAGLAQAAAAGGTRLVLISTNEVFDGERRDNLGYAEDDPTNPINPYGESKLAGENAALDAYARAGAPAGVQVVRTAWLFGPPGNDFPTKILAAAGRLAPGEPLKVVADEIGSPTYTIELASAVVQLLARPIAGGVVHLANAGSASRLEVAARVLTDAGVTRELVPISRREFARASTAPAWAVLANNRAAEAGVSLRSWQSAVDAYAGSLAPA